MMNLTAKQKEKMMRDAEIADALRSIMKGTYYFAGKVDTREDSDALGSRKVGGDAHICDVCGREHRVLFIFCDYFGKRQDVICGGGCATVAKRKALSPTAYERRLARESNNICML